MTGPNYRKNPRSTFFGLFCPFSCANNWHLSCKWGVVFPLLAAPITGDRMLVIFCPEIGHIFLFTRKGPKSQKKKTSTLEYFERHNPQQKVCKCLEKKSMDNIWKKNWRGCATNQRCDILFFSSTMSERNISNSATFSRQSPDVGGDRSRTRICATHFPSYLPIFFARQKAPILDTTTKSTSQGTFAQRLVTFLPKLATQKGASKARERAQKC